MTPDHHSNDCNYHIYEKVLVYVSLCSIWIFNFSYLMFKFWCFFSFFPHNNLFKDLGHILQRHMLLMATPCWLTKDKKWIENIFFCQLIPGPGNNPGYLCSSIEILLCYALYKTNQKGSTPETAFKLLEWKSYTWIINKPEDSFKFVTKSLICGHKISFFSFLRVLTLSANRVTLFPGTNL